jgi:hypothetical protein
MGLALVRKLHVGRATWRHAIASRGLERGSSSESQPNHLEPSIILRLDPIFLGTKGTWRRLRRSTKGSRPDT